ncbi:zf-HC2 domain-containing protein [Dyella acidisoli]|uniref:Zf-HC2 domain-containing protein n=1 Tax=Dyella acidisoli TaxID=1867834 RepID=A0ABQ5XXG9_9GAMM|nr:zf-HC2 domain-containing protein [Dyella acidisoli]GLQ95053.1 hypothetical protein GCM10007901_40060 [Dyella acidisoli]
MTMLASYFSQDCPRAWELMPWVLQHNATKKQSEWLANHLAQCEACRAEFAQQQLLQRAMSLPADTDVDAEAGLQRLLGRLDTPVMDEKPSPKRVGGWLTRALAAAVLVQAIGIGALGLKIWSGGETPATYRTLSQDSTPAAPGAIRVVPDANMTLAEWNALLHSLQLQVVGGPNEVGAYLVAPANATSKTQDTLQQLRSTRGVRLAEPVSGTP